MFDGGLAVCVHVCGVVWYVLDMQGQEQQAVVYGGGDGCNAGAADVLEHGRISVNVKY